MTDALVKSNNLAQGLDLSKVNVQISGGVKIFKTTVHVTFSKQVADKTVAIVYNDDMGKDAPSVSLSEIQGQIVNMFQNLIGTEQAITLEIPWPDSVKDKIKEIEDNILISLNVVYLKITKYDKADDPQKENSLEYALWISVKVADELLKKFPIALEDLYLKLWSSNIDPRVKEKMDISEVEKLLEPPEGSK